MRHELKIESLDRIDSAAEEFLRQLGDRRVVAFYAPMGAGKTTFTAAVCRALGVREDAVSSPNHHHDHDCDCDDDDCDCDHDHCDCDHHKHYDN